MTEVSTPETVLWLLRHPEPDASILGRCYGWLDAPLSAVGVRQAQAIAGALVHEPFAAIYTSPLERCAHAAQILAAGRSSAVESRAELREMNLGVCEGLTYDEIAQRFPDLYRHWMEHPSEAQFPEGESLTSMRSRVIPTVQELRQRHTGQTIAVVTHAGVIRILLADALQMPLSAVFRLGQSYGTINRIRYFGESPVVELFNAPPR